MKTFSTILMLYPIPLALSHLNQINLAPGLGVIPENINEIIPNLTTFDAVDTNFTGPIPQSITELDFVNFSMVNTDLEGPSPEGMSIVPAIANVNIFGGGNPPRCRLCNLYQPGLYQFH